MGTFYAAKGSPEWEEHRHCKRKVRYEEEPAEPYRGWRVYKCRFCAGYHITSKKLSRKEREKYDRRKDPTNEH